MYKRIRVCLALTGFTSVYCAGAMVLSSVSVVTNSLRLRGVKLVGWSGFLFLIVVCSQISMTMLLKNV